MESDLEKTINDLLNDDNPIYSEITRETYNFYKKGSDVCQENSIAILYLTLIANDNKNIDEESIKKISVNLVSARYLGILDVINPILEESDTSENIYIGILHLIDLKKKSSEMGRGCKFDYIPLDLLDTLYSSLQIIDTEFIQKYINHLWSMSKHK